MINNFNPLGQFDLGEITTLDGGHMTKMVGIQQTGWTSLPTELDGEKQALLDKIADMRKNWGELEPDIEKQVQGLYDKMINDSAWNNN